MTELKQKTIDIIHKVSEVLKDSEFELCKFEVFDNYQGSQRLALDIIEKEENKVEE